MRAARKIFVAATMTVASMGGLLATGSTAQAAQITKFCNAPYAPVPGCFYSTGDIFTVQDLRADGKRGVLIWMLDGGRHGECHDANGANNPPTKCDVDLPEGKLVTFWTVIRDGANGANTWESEPMVAWTSGR